MAAPRFAIATPASAAVGVERRSNDSASLPVRAARKPIEERTRCSPIWPSTRRSASDASRRPSKSPGAGAARGTLSEHRARSRYGRHDGRARGDDRSIPVSDRGQGVPLVVLAGLSPDAGVGRGPMRRTHEQARRAWTSGRRVFCLNRRVGLPLGLTMPMLAAEHAEAMRAEFGEPVDVLGLSTGGSIAQQLAADHPDVVRRLVLISTGCRLGPAARMAQRAGSPPMICATWRPRTRPRTLRSR